MSRVPRSDRRELELEAVDQERLQLHRANLRNLFHNLRGLISEHLNRFIFEFNDSHTRRAIVATINQTLEEQRARRSIQDFVVVCDESNNTPQDIDRGMLRCSVLVRPMRCAETVNLEVVIDPRGSGSFIPEEPEIIVHERDVKPVLIKYFRKLNILMED